MRSFGTVYDLAEERFELVATLIFVSLSDLAHEALGLMVGDQIYRRAAKTAAGQTSAETAGDTARELHQQIEFDRAVLKKIARAFMALEHVLAELPMIIIA